jgi:hypothetical protein
MFAVRSTTNREEITDKIIPVRGRLKISLVQVSFFESVHPPPLMPRCATALNFVIPPAPACRGTGADPDFLHRGTAQGDICGFLKAAGTPLASRSYAGNPGERRGGTCSFTRTARKSGWAIHYQPNPP